MIVLTTERLPIKVWAEAEHLVGFDNALDQARNLANHPLARKWIALMPDFHVGYGMPIGGVLAIRGGVIPNAVGVDIGCGMIAAGSDRLASEFTREDLQAIRLAIHEKVPVGNAHHKELQTFQAPVLQEPAGDVTREEYEAARRQIGTLGGGNHFIELQVDEEGRLWVMLHSGSRNVGLKVCNHYEKVAKAYMEQWHSAIPDKDLAFLPDSVPEYRQYLDEMRWCMAFAEESRLRMLEATMAILPGMSVLTLIDTHHNFAAMERHYGENLMVHRKGAVKAEGLLTIPGSMGTASYICEGLAPRESFNTCSHGAGRVMGRKEANRQFTHEQAVESMKDVVFGIKQGDYDEMPMAYKDIDTVVANQSDLVRPLHRLKPLAVVKG